MIHPDSQVFDNKIIRHYLRDGKFADYSVDQTIALKLNAYKGWKCAAAQESVYIDYDGFIFVANCRVDGPVGSIYDGFRIPSQDWITCPKDFCGCGADIMIPKALNEESKGLLVNLKNMPYAKGVHNRQTDLSGAVSATEVAFRDNRRQVFWDLHRRCNYACSYCWPEVHNNYEEVKPYKLLLKTTLELIKDFGKDKQLRFLFGGGEPTILPDFLEWMRVINEHNCVSVVTTNGSRSPEYYAELIKYASINMSIHFEFAQIDRIINNVQAILKVKKLILAHAMELKIMCPPGRVNDAIELKKKLFALEGFQEKITWSVVPIRSLEDNQFLVKYEDGEFERLKHEINL